MYFFTIKGNKLGQKCEECAEIFIDIDYGVNSAIEMTINSCHKRTVIVNHNGVIKRYNSALEDKLMQKAFSKT
jgi:hypothetical protein